MAVLLTILKVTGIVILALLALVLLTVLIILFVPVRYRIAADKSENNDDPYAKISVTFLLHMISGAFVYDKDTDYYVKLFGIRVYPRKHKEEENPDAPAGVESEAAPIRPADEEIHEDTDEDAHEEIHEQIHEDASADPEPEYTIDWNEEPEEECIPEIPDTFDEGGSDEEDLWDKFEKLTEKICDKFSSLADKYDRLKKKTEYWRREINDKRNRRAAEHIKTVVLKVLKKAAPRKVKGFIHFGSDDPSTTGAVLAFLGIIYPILPRKLIIEPDFENTVLYGKIDIKGHIALIVVAVALLKLYLDKDCRRMWYRYKRHKSDDTI